MDQSEDDRGGSGRGGGAAEGKGKVRLEWSSKGALRPPSMACERRHERRQMARAAARRMALFHWQFCFPALTDKREKLVTLIGRVKLCEPWPDSLGSLGRSRIDVALVHVSRSATGERRQAELLALNVVCVSFAHLLRPAKRVECE